jgi:hypothetical protein
VGAWLWSRLRYKAVPSRVDKKFREISYISVWGMIMVLHGLDTKQQDNIVKYEKVAKFCEILSAFRNLL